MTSASQLALSHVTDYNNIPEPEGLTLAIRTDARHATRGLKERIRDAIRSGQCPDFPITSLHRNEFTIAAAIDNIVHRAYQDWGHETLALLSETLDYSKYGIRADRDRKLNVHFYDSQRLAGLSIERARSMVPDDPVLVSLDDMITARSENERKRWADLGFSRRFSLCGRENHGYVGRPGKAPLGEQIADIRRRMESAAHERGSKVPTVFLEDNVRKASMLNWVIDKMGEHGIWDYADLNGISTCFVCASPEEQGNIRFRGHPVPIEAVVNYEGANVDVTTTRDLLFDGLVVQFDGDKVGRLPGIFMDVVERFKIAPSKAADFNAAIRETNAQFCDTLSRQLGMQIPLAWFDGSAPIAYVGNHRPEDPMAEVMRRDVPSIKPEPENRHRPPARHGNVGGYAWGMACYPAIEL